MHSINLKNKNLQSYSENFFNIKPPQLTLFILYTHITLRRVYRYTKSHQRSLHVLLTLYSRIPIYDVIVRTFDELLICNRLTHQFIIKKAVVYYKNN